jgi:hypothetical protein
MQHHRRTQVVSLACHWENVIFSDSRLQLLSILAVSGVFIADRREKRHDTTTALSGLLIAPMRSCAGFAALFNVEIIGRLIADS